ncbi:hypothetical protein HN873_001551 [Arachis hypogaea]
MFREVKKEIDDACAMNTQLVIQDGRKLYFKCNIFGIPEIDHVFEFDRVGGCFVVSVCGLKIEEFLACTYLHA